MLVVGSALVQSVRVGAHLSGSLSMSVSPEFPCDDDADRGPGGCFQDKRATERK